MHNDQNAPDFIFSSRIIINPELLFIFLHFFPVYLNIIYLPLLNSSLVSPMFSIPLLQNPVSLSPVILTLINNTLSSLILITNMMMMTMPNHFVSPSLFISNFNFHFSFWNPFFSFRNLKSGKTHI